MGCVYCESQDMPSTHLTVPCGPTRILVTYTGFDPPIKGQSYIFYLQIAKDCTTFQSFLSLASLELLLPLRGLIFVVREELSYRTDCKPSALRVASGGTFTTRAGGRQSEPAQDHRR